MAGCDPRDCDRAFTDGFARRTANRYRKRGLGRTGQHRVVCCYPDYVALLGAAADHARRQVVFSHPPRNLVSRTLLGAENLSFWLRGRAFRVFAHPPRAMLAVLSEHGLREQAVRRRAVWQVVAASR